MDLNQINDVVKGLDLKQVLTLVVLILEAFLRVFPTSKNYSIIDKILKAIKFVLNFVLPNRTREKGVRYE